ncbi:MAG: hypothetical protein AAF581_00455 [Planctomycetota bacterium]
MKSWAMKGCPTAVLALSLLVAGVENAGAQADDRYHLTVGSTNGPSGTSVSVPISFDMVTGTAGAPDAMLAWSFGVCHDPALVDITSVISGTGTATLNMGMPPSSNNIVIDPFGDGFYVAVIVDFLAVVSLPPGNHELNVATYDLLGTDGTSVPLTVCETLAFCPTCPPVPLAFDPVIGQFSTPVVQDGTLFIGTQPSEQFVRGDCNVDNALNIADPVFLLGFLFPGPSGSNVLTCLDSCDANDDGALNIADSVALLSALFTGGMIPGPNTCGVDVDNSDSLDCATYTHCP